MFIQKKIEAVYITLLKHSQIVLNVNMSKPANYFIDYIDSNQGKN